MLDEDALTALLRLGDEAFVAEVAAQFAAEGTLLLLKLARAVSEANVADFASHTHALRSSAATLRRAAPVPAVPAMARRACR